MILTETLTKALKLFPQKQAIVCGEKRWSYQDFCNRINRLSHCLKGFGIKKDDKVAILHPNCHYFLEAYYAIPQIGAISVPINYRLSPREIAFILQDSESKILIADSMFKNQVDPIRKEIRGIEKILWTGGPQELEDSIDLNYEKVLQQAEFSALPDPPINGEDIAQIYYTSGTTGRPKGVMLSHKNVTTHALGTIAEIHLTDCDVWIHVAPLFHLADAWATWAVTWVGGTHVLVREFDAKMVLETIQKEKVTLTNLIPTMLNLMVNHPDVGKFNYSSLRVLLSGGAPIAPEVVRKIVETFKCDYIQTYGMTETSPYLTLSILKDHLKNLSNENQLRFKSKTGREFIGVELKVVNDRGGEVKKDEKEVGEIIVKGDSVTKGYWKLPEETKKSIKDGWLYTGDMAVIDEEGYVTIVDRKKDMILTGGENVYSTEVENVLYMHPAILECAVIGIPDPKWGEAVKGIVVLKPSQRATEQEIIQFCKEKITHYKAPKSIDFIEALPRTGSGKIHKKGLRDKYWEGYEKKVH
ncbi:MAG: AMP-dependent synthetase [Deltaproteobacteria bacterium CG03_land_8_20_14_0_80_45_14]|nr:MAG: AMP-dependent synthetase [Deltaproteobacteria bacterium CG03_land_8_20_14_0_80_45_14]